MPTQTAPAVNTEDKLEATLAKVRDLAKNALTLEEFETASITGIVERLAHRLEISQGANCLKDRDIEDLKRILGFVTGSLQEVKFVATTLIASDNPQVFLNETEIPQRCRGWKMRAERALQLALPYCPDPEAPSHREPLPEINPKKIVPASKAVDLRKDSRGRHK